MLTTRSSEASGAILICKPCAPENEVRNSSRAIFSECKPARRTMRTSIDCLFSPSKISTCFQLSFERCMAVATCSTVTIDVGDKNQAVPRIPRKSESGSWSLAEIPCDTYRRVSQRRGIDTCRRRGRACKSQVEQGKQPEVNDQPIFRRAARGPVAKRCLIPAGSPFSHLRNRAQLTHARPAGGVPIHRGTSPVLPST